MTPDAALSLGLRLGYADPDTAARLVLEAWEAGDVTGDEAQHLMDQYAAMHAQDVTVIGASDE